MADVTPAFVGLAGIAVGALGSGFVERGKDKRQRKAKEAEERRTFRIEALERLGPALFAAQMTAFGVGFSWRTNVHNDARSSNGGIDVTFAEVMRWVVRVHNADV